MVHNNYRAIPLYILLLTILAAPACTQPYRVSLSTPEIIIPTGQSLFVSPLPPQNMATIQAHYTETIMALTATPTPVTTGTPAVDLTAIISGTGTQGYGVTPTSTPTGTATNPYTTVFPTVIHTRPATYTLQESEFPYCIARRFNLDPDDLLTLNGLSSGDLYMPGLTLTIPQSGSWPGDRALHHHPDTYTVDSSDETIFGIACYYGDVDPADIARLNTLQLTAALSIGQRLQIP